ncbi:ATP-binding protein [Glaciecola siphonariae]|uniref:histidine kinase n=1 Tax=Glaciecola siphonariae TaxID=521012 RepID=A0ABV9LWS2_9ALTE
MTKILRAFTSLNPANSLFGKIFIWFWLSVTTLLVCAFVLARIIRPGLDVSSATQEQIKQGERVSGFVQMALERGIEPNRALRRVANRGKWQLMLVNVATEELVLGFPPPILPNKRPILELAQSTQRVHISAPNMEFVGPFEVKAPDATYKLFVGRLLKREERRPESWGVALLVIIAVGSLLCLLLAWRLTKPLRELSQASRAFAAGDLRSRVGSSNGSLSRRDEIGQLANDFNDMADKLNTSLQQQNMLLANVSHELRTPLTRLQLAGAMLQDKYHGDAYLDRIEHEITTMDKLIGQILKLTRMQNAKRGMAPEHEQGFKNLSLDELVLRCIADLEFEAQALSKNLACSALPQVKLMANQEAFVSALENITRNAIRYARSRISLGFVLDAETLRISIEDDGAGLAPGDIDKLFEPFFQAPSSTSLSEDTEFDTADGGVGLGLSIAKAAIELHNGSISAATSDLGGLRFTIDVPIIAPKAC